MLDLAPNNVENERIARDLLVRLNLDDVTSLNAAPVRDLEALVSLGENKLFDRLTIDFFSGLFKFFVVQKVKAAGCNDTGHGNKDHVGVVGCLALPRDRLRTEMDQKHHMVELEDSFVQENGESPETLNRRPTEHISNIFSDT